MRTQQFFSCVATAAALAAQNAFPLPASAAPGSTNAFENTAPFVAPARMDQSLIVNRTTLNGQGLPATFGLWDMSDYDPTGRYIFTPSEVGTGCGLFRYDTQTGALAVLMVGNTLLLRNPNPVGWLASNDNFSRFDPCTWTPFGTVITGEETTGGRAFEVTNPLSAGPFQVRWLSQIPSVAHEGMRFDRNGNLYLVDEDNSGCIYKFVPATPGDLSVGQTFVLSVNSYATNPNAVPSEAWNSTANRLTNRFGLATWVPLTGPAGVQITTANPFAYVTTTGGRTAADEVFGTPYGRPEDMDVNRLASGNDCLYVAITSETRVISIELLTSSTAMVREFINYDTMNLATGSDVNPLQNDPYTSPGSGTVFATPDNIAVDAWGSIYAIEDGEPNGGDIWKAIDTNRDGVAEAIGLFLSLGITGSEPSGMLFNPAEPWKFAVNIQHPASGNDATWEFDTRPYAGSDLDLVLKGGVNELPRTGPGECVRTAKGFDTVVMRVESPNGALDTAPFTILLQPFATSAGQPIFLPPLWMSPFSPMFVLIGGYVGQFPTVLPYGGTSVAVTVPPGLLGLSIMTQAVAVSGVGSLVLTDGLEFILK